MTDITDELKEWVMRNIAPCPVPTGQGTKTDASSGNALSGKGGGRDKGGSQRARATDRRGGGAASDLGKGKEAGPLGQKPRQLVGREATTSNKGTRFRVYRVAPLLAVVVDGEE